MLLTKGFRFFWYKERQDEKVNASGGPAYRVLCEGRGCSAVTAKMHESVLM